METRSVPTVFADRVNGCARRTFSGGRDTCFVMANCRSLFKVKVEVQDTAGHSPSEREIGTESGKKDANRGSSSAARRR